MVRPMPKTCEKCGRLMPDGALAYEVRIQVAADFDGVLPVAEAEADLPGQMHDLVAAMEHADPDRLLREERGCLRPSDIAGRLRPLKAIAGAAGLAVGYL